MAKARIARFERSRLRHTSGIAAALGVDGALWLFVGIFMVCILHVLHRRAWAIWIAATPLRNGHRLVRIARHLALMGYFFGAKIRLRRLCR